MARELLAAVTVFHLDRSYSRRSPPRRSRLLVFFINIFVRAASFYGRYYPASNAALCPTGIRWK